MGCVNNYCSNGSDLAVPKDNIYQASIISNMLTNQQFSNKTNNKLLFVNFYRKESDNINSSCVNSNNNGTFLNSEKKLPINPLPFVKLRPKKNMLLN